MQFTGSHMSFLRLIACLLVQSAWMSPVFLVPAQTTPAPGTSTVAYLRLTAPQRILADAQAWEGKEFPHTLSVLQLKRGGFRYWGWYGLNEGGGIGLARSNDLRSWIKYQQNPLWANARWPSVLAQADAKRKNTLFFAITRDYDTPSSYIVLASSEDGIHLKEEKVLVKRVPNQRNQNPNLFRDPRSGRFYLTFYRGNDRDHFEIVSRSAASPAKLDSASEKVLIESKETVAAPTLLYIKHAGGPSANGLYFLATEIYPARYTDNPDGEWQVKVFASDSPDGDFQPVAGNPIMRGQRACLFQYVFHDRFYGFDCHLTTPDQWVLEETEASLP
jgi:hypothetical protein